MKAYRVIALAALATAVSQPLRAQTLYGLAPDADHANDHDVYRIRVRQEVIGLLGNLKRAWDGDDAKAAADLYTRDGVLLLSGEEARGKMAVQQRLDSLVTASGPLTFSVQDFDFSGDMAYARGIMSYGPGDGTEAPAQTYVLIAKRQRGDVWVIRALTLSPPPPKPAAAAPAAAN